MGDEAEAGGQRALPRVRLLLLASGPAVGHLHPVAVLEEVGAGLLAPPRVQGHLGARAPVRPPVHQHLGGDHDGRARER